jgi:hypothetical protein
VKKRGNGRKEEGKELRSKKRRKRREGRKTESNYKREKGKSIKRRK